MKPARSRGFVVIALGAGAVLASLALGGIVRAGAQDASTPQSTAEEVSEAPALRRRLVDAASQDEVWVPDLSMTPAEEARELVQRGDQALAAGRPEDAAGGAIASYSRALDRNPNNQDARGGIDRAVAQIVARGEAAVAAGRFDEAAGLSAMANRHRSQNAAVRSLSAKIAAGREQAQQLATAQRHIDEGRLVAPDGNNAVEVYRALLASSPDNAAARSGLVQVEATLLEQASAAAEAGDFAEADRLLAQAGVVAPGSSAAQDAGTRIVAQRARRAADIEAAIGTAIEAGQHDEAERLVGQLEGVSLEGRSVEALRTRVENARKYASFSPGDVFTDPVASGGEGPVQVVIPMGTFMMGSPDSERERAGNEGPQFQVRLSRGFAMSQTEVTVAQFRQFVDATGYVTSAQQSGRTTVYDESTGSMGTKSGIDWQNDHLGRRADADLPVIHVSWNDAKAYVDWLARETGQHYRLPTEAEYEYALRAGTQTAYPWGDASEPAGVVGNLTGDRDRSRTGHTWPNGFRNYSDGHWGPAPVRTYPPNAFGLYNMVGNTSEWVEGCWQHNHLQAPSDGSARVNPGCTHRVIRGASWANAPSQVRSAFRLSEQPTSTDPRLGFRVVREF